MFFPTLSHQLKAAVGELATKKVAVLGHSRPDGDCIGSQVALCRVLRSQSVDAICINPDPVPRRLAFLVGDTPFYSADSAPEFDRVAITTDCADQGRTGTLLQEKFSGIFANVDHHISNTMYAERNYVDPDAAATAEILAGVFLDLEWSIDATTAQALFVGIATDTGQFRFPSTTRRVFTITGCLLDYGAQPSDASIELYERESLAKMRLLQHYLSSLKMECGNRVCIGYLSQDVFSETGTTGEDTEGLVDYARSIDEAEIAIFLEEKADGIKGSIRCKDPVYRVDQIARAFDGGGHACAAGFNSDLPLPKFYSRLIEVIEKHLDQMDNEAIPQ